MTQDEIITFLAQVLAYGGSTTFIAYSLFKWLGAKWIDAHFNKRLEEFKKKQNQEFEDYKFRVNSLFNRISKIHEKEFEVLPELWIRLQKAYGRVVYLTSKIKRYPDLDNMPEAEVGEFLEKSRLLESHKEKIKTSRTKLQDYIEIIYYYDLSDSEKYLKKFKNYLISNKVFLSKDLHDLFGEINEILKEAIEEYETMVQVKDIDKIIHFSQQLVEKIDPIIEAIENKIQERLQCQSA